MSEVGFEHALRKARARVKKRVRKAAEASPAIWYARALRGRVQRRIAMLTHAPENERFGVNLVGFFEGSLGLGESVRHAALALDASSIPHAFLSLPSVRDSKPAGVPIGNELPYALTVLHIGPAETLSFLETHGRRAHVGKKLVGIWYWELEETPDALIANSLVLDEIWVASRWLAQSLSRSVHCPVKVYPYPLDHITTSHPVGEGNPPIETVPVRVADDRFVFFTAFDHHSDFVRKNPEGALRAYLEAFPTPSDSTVFIVKSLNGESAVANRRRLESLAAGREDIVLFDADLSDEAMASLYARADCFVSLHRSEGLGLGFLHAVLSGRSAIVTGYSAPAEFAALEGLHLVRYSRTPVKTSFPRYRIGGEWAEPDESHAASIMRSLAAVGRSPRTPRPAPAAHTSEAFTRFVAERTTALLGATKPSR